MEQELPDFDVYGTCVGLCGHDECKAGYRAELARVGYDHAEALCSVAEREEDYAMEAMAHAHDSALRFAGAAQ